MGRKQNPPRHPTSVFLARERVGISQTELARRSGVNKQTIGKLEKGQLKLSRKWADLLSPHLAPFSSEQLVYWDRSFPGDHIESGALTGLSEAAPQPALAVRLVGYVGAGAAAHFYAIAQGDLDEVAAPAGATASTVAVEVRGNSMGALFDRWLVYYDDVKRPVTSDLIGKLCVVGLADDRVLVKKIRRGASGAFDLISENEEPIRGAAIEWAARVISMTPPR